MMMMKALAQRCLSVTTIHTLPSASSSVAVSGVMRGLQGAAQAQAHGFRVASFGTTGAVGVLCNSARRVGTGPIRYFSSSSASSSSSSSSLTSAGRLAAEALRQPSSAAAIQEATRKAAAAAVPPLVAGGAAATRQVTWWLAGCTGLVFSMVVIGGITRLTRSGLSMTEWKFLGTLPPMNDHEWDVEFGKYKKSPEYRRCNSGMTIDEFKFIYWMEYAHRMWGRGLGIAFGVPLMYFGFKGHITRRLALPLGVLFVAGGCQGLIGWWMVKSGLNEPLYHYEIPRVSPYRLATHLTSAFAIYTGLLWTTLSVALPESPASLSGSAAIKAGAAKLRGMVVPLTALIGLTAVSGAFVAGLDAGHAYNTFPLMNGSLVPTDEIFRLRPMWKNFFENTATVQFDHRVLAASTLCSVAAVWGLSRGVPMPARSAMMLNALMAVTCMQVSLGVATLLNHVPVSLGSAHQAGALTLFSVAVSLLHSLRR